MKGRIRSQIVVSPSLLASFCCFWCVHEEGVTGEAQEAIDLLRSASTHTASLLYGFNWAAGGANGGERTSYIVLY